MQGKEKPKTTAMARMSEQTMYPPVKGPLRALQAQLNTLQHLRLWPLHRQLHIQQHPLLQPPHLWLRAQALLACLTKPMVWNHSLLTNLRHPWPANPWQQGHPRLVFTSRPPVLNLVPIIGSLSVFALFGCLAIPCQSLALLCLGA